MGIFDDLMDLADRVLPEEDSKKPGAEMNGKPIQIPALLAVIHNQHEMLRMIVEYGNLPPDIASTLRSTLLVNADIIDGMMGANDTPS